MGKKKKRDSGIRPWTKNHSSECGRPVGTLDSTTLKISLSLMKHRIVSSLKTESLVEICKFNRIFIS